MGIAALRIGAVRGIDVRIDISWAFIAILVTWSYWNLFDGRPQHAGSEALVMAGAAAVLFFASVLAHELAHALEAKRRDVHVGSITLFLFGGVTETKFDVKRPIDEFALTAVGPFTSFVIGAALGLTAYAADEAGLDSIAAVAGLVGWLNVALGVFNLLPGAPLDGGRILRAVVWWATNDRRRAVRVAARAGQGLGGLVLTLGLFELFFVPGAFTGGLWFAFIGWFLLRAATGELADSELRTALGSLTAGDLAQRRIPLQGDDSLATAIARFRDDEAVALAVAEGDRTIGALVVDALGRTSAEEGASVRDAMTPIDELPVVAADASAVDVVDHLADAGLVVVADNGAAAGIVTTPRLLHILRHRQLLESGPAR